MTGEDSKFEAAGVPGRVGENRIDGLAGALGSNVFGIELTGESPPAIVTGVTLSEPPRGAAAGAESSVLETVSDGEGAGLFGELHPGFAKISTSAKTWMPTTTPKILRIFMSRSVGGLRE